MLFSFLFFALHGVFLTSVCFLYLFFSLLVSKPSILSFRWDNCWCWQMLSFLFLFHIVWTLAIFQFAGSIQIKLNCISCYFSTSNWRILLFSSNMYLSVHVSPPKVQFNEHIPIITFKITKLMFLHQILMKHTPKILPLFVLLNWWETFNFSDFEFH